MNWSLLICWILKSLYCVCSLLISCMNLLWSSSTLMLYFSFILFLTLVATFLFSMSCAASLFFSLFSTLILSVFSFLPWTSASNFSLFSFFMRSCETFSYSNRCILSGVAEGMTEEVWWLLFTFLLLATFCCCRSALSIFICSAFDSWNTSTPGACDDNILSIFCCWVFLRSPIIFPLSSLYHNIK